MKLIDSLLELSRASSLRFVRPDTPLDIGAFARELVDEMRPMAEEKGLDLALEVESSGGRPMITDPRAVRLVLANLVDNALKFTERGSVRVHVAFDAASCVIDVVDTGPGIAIADRPRIFEPFERSRRSDGVPGIGLGLALVREVVDALGGVIDVHDVDGGGADFRVRLPLEPPARQAPSENRPIA